jgi:hypothetical protein
MNKSPFESGSFAYYDHVSESAEFIHELAHDQAFDAFMKSSWATKEQFLQMDSFVIEREYLPPSMQEAHYFPHRIIMDNFSAYFIRYRNPQDPDGEDWVLNASYAANGELFQLAANHNGLEIKTESNTGNQLQYHLSNKEFIRLLLGFIGAHNQDTHFNSALLEQVESNAGLSQQDVIGKLLRMLGNLNGKYERRSSTGVLKAYDDRSLIAQLTDVETPNSSSISVTLHAAHEVIDCPVAYEFAHFEQMGTNAGAIRTASRRQLENSGVENLGIDVQFGLTESTLIDPKEDPLAWQCLMSTIYGTLRQNMGQ